MVGELKHNFYTNKGAILGLVQEQRLKYYHHLSGR